MFYLASATADDVDTLRDIAEKTWWPTYSAILSSDQIRYMLDKLYSPQVLTQAITDGSQSYILLYDEGRPAGFASYGQRQEDPGVCKLHKLYILPEHQGKGYGKLLIEEVKTRLHLKNIFALDVNVNRFNPARTFYESIGFKILREENIPIGPYWMNDFVMRLNFSTEGGS